MSNDLIDELWVDDGGMPYRTYDLEDRLIAFSASVIKFCSALPQTYALVHLAKQLIRSSTSAALNYGELQAAESRKDFVHKMKLSLKELRESLINLKIFEQIQHSHVDKSQLHILKDECNQLVSIFVASLRTISSSTSPNHS